MADEVSIIVRAQDQFSGVLGNFGSLITGIESAISLAGEAFLFFTDQAALGLEAISQYERLAATMETLVAREILMSGGAENMAEALGMAAGEAEQLLQWTQELAIHSPFTQEGVATAFRTAMAYGFTADEAQRLTQALIDFASGSGASEDVMGRIALALGQIEAKGRLAGQEVLQLVNAGLPVDQILAEAFGRTTAEIVAMREDGLIPASQAIEAITVYLETNFAGAAERQATTWAGLRGTFQDLQQMGLREFFGDMFEAIQPLAIAFSEWFQSEGIERMSLWGSILGDITGIIISLAQGDISGVLENLVTFSELFSEALSGDLAGALQVFEFWTSAGLEPLEALEQALINLSRGDGPLSIFAQAVLDFAPNLQAISEAWESFTFWLDAGMTPLQAAYQGLHQLEEDGGPLGRIADYISDILDIAGSEGVFSALDTFIGDMIDGLTDAIEQWVDTGGPERLSAAIVRLFDSVVEDPEAQSGIVSAFGRLLSVLGDAFSQMDWDSIVDSLDQAISRLIENVDWYQVGLTMRSFASLFWRGLFDGLGEQGAQDRPAMASLASAIADLISGIFEFPSVENAIASAGAAFMDGIIDGIEMRLGIASASTVMAGIAMNMVGGLIIGWNSLFGVFLSIVNAGVGNLLNIFEPLFELFGIDIGEQSGGAGGTWPGTSSGNGSGSQTVNNYYYGPVYFQGAGEPGSYFDCPSPNPLMEAGSGLAGGGRNTLR